MYKKVISNIKYTKFIYKKELEFWEYMGLGMCMLDKRENKTYRIRDSALKAYHYLRALAKIESDAIDSFILEAILQEGIERINELEKDAKMIYISNYGNERYNIGGLIDKELHATLKNYAKKYGWKIQECAEICIYLSCVNKMNENEKSFFKINEWRIVIV